MREFKSHRSYKDFASAVTRHWRYVLPEEHCDFLQTVLATSKDKYETIPRGALLYRAQVGHDWQAEDLGDGVTENIPRPFCPQRMKPLRDRAFEGRANPKGIPCLYTATQEDTAINEVRPWVGVLVSVASLRTNRELRVVNCTIDDHRARVYFSEPDAERRHQAVWQDIDCAFSEPVTRTDDVAS